MTIMTIIFLLLAVLAYVIICLIVEKDIRGKLGSYKEETFWKHGIVNNRISQQLENNSKKLIVFGAIGWPMYYLFYIGASLGSDIYDLLIGDNYENRIATWFI
jgi:hypothetical protein